MIGHGIDLSSLSWTKILSRDLQWSPDRAEEEVDIEDEDIQELSQSIISSHQSAINRTNTNEPIEIKEMRIINQNLLSQVEEEMPS